MLPSEGFLQAARVRSAPDQRSRHRKAGTVITARDVTALRWIGEQYAIRFDALGVLLGRLSPAAPHVPGLLGAKTVAQVVGRWNERGLAERYRLLGHQWAVPTRAALHLVGLEFPVWSPVVTMLAHVHAVALVRLALEPTLPEGGRWLSERELRRESTGRAYLPDGAVELPEAADPRPAAPGLLGEPVERLAPRVGVEVELTRKSAARLRDIWSRPRHGRWLWTVYYAPPEVAGYLRGQLTRIQPAHRIDVRSLPEVEGATYGGAR